MSMNLAQRFFETAAAQPGHPLILRQDGPAVTYAEFAARVREIADSLSAAGVNAGDNIGLLHPSGDDYIAFVYALWTLGASVTPFPIELTAPEKLEIFERIHLDGVAASERFSRQLTHPDRRDWLPVGRNAVFAKVEASVAAPPELAAVNPAFIRFTSGTTGGVKGVVLSHETVWERIHAANDVVAIGPEDRVLWLLSMDYHFTVSIVAYLSFGAGIILPKNSFGVTMLAAARQHGATVMYASPTHYSLMAQDDTVDLPENLRLAIVTTAALRPETGAAFHARFGRVLNETYGIIELGLPAVNTSGLASKQGSVGRVLPSYGLRLDCAPGEDTGEITFRGTGMLDAYYSPWCSRESILERGGGWFRTGDLGRLDEDGYLHIIGRVKEMISVGGMKFFPDEVETVLESHPAVHAACVYGAKADRWGEIPEARLVVAPGCTPPEETELRAHCRTRLADHKIPTRFEWVERLAYTASGKKIRNPERMAAMVGVGA